MQIALFNPECPVLQPDVAPQDDHLHPPLGLLSLATYCVHAGHEARVFDLATVPHPGQTLARELEAHQPDVVGLTALSATVGSALAHAHSCRERGIRVVVGGHAALCHAEVLLGSGAVDAVICGEGELPLTQLLAAWEAGRDPAGITGVRLPGHDTFTPAPRIGELDRLPPINFDLLDVGPYLEQESLALVTSRGCPFNCRFCACQRMWSRKTTFHSTARTVAMVDDLVLRYDYAGKLLTFLDDTFTLDRRRTRAFCEAMQRRPRDRRPIWKAMTRADTVNELMLNQMHRAGCRHLVFGIEATNDDDLGRLNKGFTVTQAKSAIALARRAKIKTEAYFMMGFPWQGRDDLFRSVERITEFGADVNVLSCLTPYPGTHFAENLTRYGMRMPFEDTARFNHLLPVVETDRFSLSDQAEAMLCHVEQNVLQSGRAAAVSTGADRADRAARELAGGSTESARAAQGTTGEVSEQIDLSRRCGEVSRHLVFRERGEQVLAHQYLSGAFALLNREAMTILDLCRDSSTLGDLVAAARLELGQVEARLVHETLDELHELAFVLEG